MKDKRARPLRLLPLAASNCFLCKQAKTKPVKMWSKQQIYAEENWFVLTNFRELLAHRSKV